MVDELLKQVIGNEKYHTSKKHNGKHEDCKECIWDKEHLVLRKDCKCKCHFDGSIRHTKETLCCATPNLLMYAQPCEHPEHACMIEPEAMIGQAQITDVKKSYPTMIALQKATGCVMFGFDPKFNSLDIHFKRGEHEWDYGAGIQVNGLTADDKKALQEYLDHGR